MATEPADRLTNHDTASAERQLALEIRSRRFGFAVLQGTNLLDWGVRSYPPGAAGTKSAIKRIRFLLTLYAPSTVIARRTRRAKGESSGRASRIFEKIQNELQRRSIRFAVLSRRDVRAFF